MKAHQLIKCTASGFFLISVENKVCLKSFKKGQVNETQCNGHIKPAVAIDRREMIKSLYFL